MNLMLKAIHSSSILYSKLTVRSLLVHSRPATSLLSVYANSIYRSQRITMSTLHNEIPSLKLNDGKSIPLVRLSMSHCMVLVKGL